MNNNYALHAIQENLDVNGLRFHDQLLSTTKMVAKQLRTRILDIVIATINGRAGEGTKHINKRAMTPDEFDRSIDDAYINFDNILEANREDLKRLKQA